MATASATPIGPLLQTVFTSILEVFILCLAGYILARRGILDRKTQKQLNRLNVCLFTPSLLFSKVAFFLSPAKLRELWIIPIFFVLVTGVSMVVSFLLGWIFRLKRSQRSFAMAAAMFMNSNSLPIALMQSLVVTVPGLKWGQDDNKDAMLGRALTYLVLFSTLGMVLRWSYGVHLLTRADTDPVDIHRDTRETRPLLSDDETAFPSPAIEQGVLQNPYSEATTQVDTDEDRDVFNDEHHSNFLPNITIEDADRLHPSPAGPMNRHTSFFRSFPNSPTKTTPNASPPTLNSQLSSDDEGSDDELPSGLPRHRHRRDRTEITTPPTSTRFQSLLRRSRRRISKALHTLNDFMTVPLWASLASIVVACVQPLQHALEQHMQPVKGSLAAAGSCSIPVTLIVLGGYFYTPPEPHVEETGGGGRERRTLSTVTSSASLMSTMKEIFKMKPTRETPFRRQTGNDALLTASRERGRPGETKTVIIAVASRMIITPLLLLPLMALSTRFNIQSVFDDPVFVVVNVLLIASPPAVTLAQITQAASGDSFERLISRTIFWAYCVITPPSTVFVVVIGLLLSRW